MKTSRYVVPYTSMYHVSIIKYQGGYPKTGMCIFLGRVYHFKRIGDDDHRVSFFELYQTTFTEDCIYRLYLSVSMCKEYVLNRFRK